MNCLLYFLSIDNRSNKIWRFGDVTSKCFLHQSVFCFFYIVIIIIIINIIIINIIIIIIIIIIFLFWTSTPFQ